MSAAGLRVGAVLRHITSDQIGHKRRDSIKLTVCLPEFNFNVLALDVAGFTKPLAKRGHIAR